MLIAGIDEAGRGPVLGPMVLAIAVIGKQDEQKLIDIGVKDSKQLTEKARDAMYPALKEILLEYHTLHVQPEEIDKMVAKRGLNELEAMKAAKLINSLKNRPDVVYVDSPDVVMSEFAKRIGKYLAFPVKIVSEHKADVNYPIVSAASVLAKVERDAEIKKISAEFGNIGSGYSHDEVTIRFLKEYFINNNHMPRFVRQSWQTTKDLREEKFQKKLFE